MSILGTMLPSLERRGGTLKDKSGWFFNWLTESNRTASGETVTPETALAFSAYFAARRNISEDVAKLPLGIYRALRPRGREELREHPVAQLLDAPNPEMVGFTFRQTLTAHALGYHGAFAEIRRNGAGVPAVMHVLNPSNVTVWVEPQGNVLFEHRGVTGTSVMFTQDQIFHIHGLGLDGITGYVMARVAKESLGSALAAQRFSAAFFGNSAITSGILEYPGIMTPEARERLRESFEDRHKREPYRPIIVEAGLKYIPISVDPEKSQLLETLQFHIEDVARWFRIPPHKLMHLLRATYSNIEHQNTEYVVDCLMPWLIRWEQEIKRKLLGNGPSARQLYAKHNVNGLLRGDSTARASYYTSMFNIGVYSDNDILEKEDEPPIEDGGGDTHYVQGNLHPTNLPWPTEPPPNAPPDIPPPDEEPDQDEPPAQSPTDRVRIIAAFESLLMDQFSRILRLEIDRLQKHAAEPNLNWLEPFYDDLRKRIEIILSPTLGTMRQVLSMDDSVDLLTPVARAYTAISISRIRREGVTEAITHWGQDRVAPFVSSILHDWQSTTLTNDTSQTLVETK